MAVGPKKLGFLASRYTVSKGVREAATGVLRGRTRDVSQQIRISGYQGTVGIRRTELEF